MLNPVDSLPVQASLNLAGDVVKELLTYLHEQAVETARLKASHEHDVSKIKTLAMELTHLKRLRYGVKSKVFTAERQDLFQETVDADQSAHDGRPGQAAPSTGILRARSRRHPLPTYPSRIKISHEKETRSYGQYGRDLIQAGEGIRIVQGRSWRCTCLVLGCWLLFTVQPGLVMAGDTEFTVEPTRNAQLPRAYVSLAWVVPTSALGLTYTGWDDNGRVDQEGYDEFDDRSAAGLPWLSLGLRLRNDFWIGGEYQAVEADSPAKIRVRSGIRPFSFFISSAIQGTYKHDEARVWLSYEPNISASALQLGAYAGFYLTTLRYKAFAADVGEYEDTLRGAAPLLGIKARFGRVQDARVSLTADFARLGNKETDANATALSVALERQFYSDWVIGVGYMQRDISVRWNKKDYDAGLDLRLRGVFMQMTKRFL